MFFQKGQQQLAFFVREEENKADEMNVQFLKTVIPGVQGRRPHKALWHECPMITLRA